jgi:hypothetical protein
MRLHNEANKTNQTLKKKNGQEKPDTKHLLHRIRSQGPGTEIEFAAKRVPIKGATLL